MRFACKAGSTKMKQDSARTAGIDTAKGKLDVAIDGSPEFLTVSNDAAGWGTLSGWLGGHGVKRVGIEATGGYERGVVVHLRGAGFEVLVLQPLQVKAWAKLHRRRAKNDRIDARLIAAVTAALEPPEIAPDERLTALAERLTYVEQIELDVVRLKVRLEHLTDARLRRQVLGDLARIEKRKTAELKRLEADLKGHDDLRARFELVLSVPGIGPRTALAIVILLPELGRVDREEAAALAGLAPFDVDSGQHKGERHIAGGRARLRRSLYAAAGPACRWWNPALKAFFAGLVARGKAYKAAVTACARKLVVYANAVVARGTPWIDKAPSAARSPA